MSVKPRRVLRDTTGTRRDTDAGYGYHPNSVLSSRVSPRRRRSPVTLLTGTKNVTKVEDFNEEHSSEDKRRAYFHRRNILNDVPKWTYSRSGDGSLLEQSGSSSPPSSSFLDDPPLRVIPVSRRGRGELWKPRSGIPHPPTPPISIGNRSASLPSLPLAYQDSNIKPLIPTLPNGSHPDLFCISPDTLSEVIHGQHEIVKECRIFDCRFKYEYEGGHIWGAINLKEEDAEKMVSIPNPIEGLILLFYCEFSRQRAPNLCRHFRKLDRVQNIEKYPELNYPQLFILEGGYRAFFREHKALCQPDAYIEMNDTRFAAQRNLDLKKLRKTISWGGNLIDRSTQTERPHRSDSDSPTQEMAIFSNLRLRAPEPIASTLSHENGVRNGLDSSLESSPIRNGTFLLRRSLHDETDAVVIHPQRRTPNVNIHKQLTEPSRLSQLPVSLTSPRSAFDSSEIMTEGLQQVTTTTSAGQRRWTNEEHQRFLEAARIYGEKDIRRIAEYVKTRTPTQVRTHAQNYAIRLNRVTLDDLLLDISLSTYSRYDLIAQLLSLVKYCDGELTELNGEVKLRKNQLELINNGLQNMVKILRDASVKIGAVMVELFDTAETPELSTVGENSEKFRVLLRTHSEATIVDVVGLHFMASECKIFYFEELFSISSDLEFEVKSNMMAMNNGSCILVFVTAMNKSRSVLYWSAVPFLFYAGKAKCFEFESPGEPIGLVESGKYSVPNRRAFWRVECCARLSVEPLETWLTEQRKQQFRELQTELQNGVIEIRSGCVWAKCVTVCGSCVPMASSFLRGQDGLGLILKYFPESDRQKMKIFDPWKAKGIEQSIGDICCHNAPIDCFCETENCATETVYRGYLPGNSDGFCLWWTDDAKLKQSSSFHHCSIVDACSGMRDKTILPILYETELLRHTVQVHDTVMQNIQTFFMNVFKPYIIHMVCHSSGSGELTMTAESANDQRTAVTVEVSDMTVLFETANTLARKNLRCVIIVSCGNMVPLATTLTQFIPCVVAVPNTTNFELFEASFFSQICRGESILSGFNRSLMTTGNISCFLLHSRSINPSMVYALDKERSKTDSAYEPEVSCAQNEFGMLLVCISKYRSIRLHDFSKIEDAKLLIEKYKSVFIDNLGYYRDNVIVVSDIEGFDEFISSTDNPNTLLDFIRGYNGKFRTMTVIFLVHGVRVFADGESEPALCLSQSRYSSLSLEWENVLQVDELIELLRVCAEHVLLILEACHGGFSVQNEDTNSQCFREYTQKTTPPMLRKPDGDERIRGLFVLTSTSPHQVSRFGVFGEYIMKCLSAGGWANKSGLITASLLAHRIHTMMPTPPIPTIWQMVAGHDFALSQNKFMSSAVHRLFEEDSQLWLDDANSYILKARTLYDSIFDFIGTGCSGLNSMVEVVGKLCENLEVEKNMIEQGNIDFMTPTFLKNLDNQCSFWASLLNANLAGTVKQLQRSVDEIPAKLVREMVDFMRNESRLAGCLINPS